MTDRLKDGIEVRRSERLRLPKVIVTSVIRSTNKGQSHGGLHLVDLATGTEERVMDWDAAGIDWTGRGGDRGLRGVAFWDDKVLLAASDEVFVYSSSLDRLRSFKNPYLRHCHEIDVAEGVVYLTSCGFDSILSYDLRQERFTAGYCIRPAALSRRFHRAVHKTSESTARRFVPRPRLQVFDPEVPGGPRAGDTCHVNSVRVWDGRLFFSGRVLDHVYEISAEGLARYGRIPLQTHNAQPYLDGLLLNDTDGDRVLVTDRAGNWRRSFDVPRYHEAELENLSLARGKARQAFGRGLAVWEDRFIIAGSSPATITVYDLETGETVMSLNLTMDVRNAVHGLEVWPYDAP